jgi:nucleotide-binding universal stress UspA family protein
MNILCPVDFSRHARAALRLAAGVARRTGGRLTVLYVTHPLLTTAAAAAAYDIHRLNAQTEVELRRFVRQTLGPEALPLTILHLIGHPAAAIQKAARRLAVDLIVVGTHGLSGTRKLFFGSTTEQVIRHADVPVLAVPHVRSRPRSRRTDAQDAWPGETVVVPTDLEADALTRAKATSGFADRFGARVTFVHVVDTTTVPGWLESMTGGNQASRLKVARERLHRLVAAVGGGAESRVVSGNPVDEIVRVASESDAQLMILTLKRGKGFLGRRYGSISYRLLCAGAASVLAIPPSRVRTTRKA